MKTDAVTPADLSRSVISVPPMAWDKSGKVSTAENRKVVDYMAAGGVTTFLYGGNANFYHLSVSQYGQVAEMLQAIAPAKGWMRLVKDSGFRRISADLPRREAPVTTLSQQDMRVGDRDAVHARA